MCEKTSGNTEGYWDELVNRINRTLSVPNIQIPDPVYEEVALKWLNTGAQYSGTVKAILTSKKLVEKAKENKTTVKKAKVVSTKSPKATKKEAKGE